MGLRGRRESDEHREFEDMAVAHVVGGLPADQGRIFRSHLLECPSCRARVGELRAIAHDLADVERDERRLRTAKRTETKSAEEDGEPAVSAVPRLSGRATLVMAAGLTILMALSAWNFVLRGRLQQAEQTLGLLRSSVTVLQDGEPWSVVQQAAPSVDGQVSTLEHDLEQSMVIMVDGLVERSYGIYLMRSDGRIIHRDLADAPNGLLYESIANHTAIESADRVLVIRTDELPTNPDGTTVFEARRPDSGNDIGIQPVVEPSD
jgi:hypothetical protein